VRSLIALTIAAVVQLCPSASGERKAAVQMVDAGGYKIELLKQGSGSPAVVFVSGGFAALFEQWGPVQDRISEFTQTVVYNRGGSGGSEPAPPPRDSKHIASELHVALRSARVKPPYIFVGQSIGGIHVRVYAHMYPTDVAGLVLVDPTSEDYMIELGKVRPEQMPGVVGSLPEAAQREYDLMDTDFQQAREAWPLPPVPVAVLTSMHPGTDLTRDSPMLWLALHKELVARIPGAQHIITDKAGHAIHSEQPALVVDAIRDVLNRIRNSK
jgi:pimeloyl-ACP methyl ester carboxylesterase